MSNRTRTRRSVLQTLGVAGTGAVGLGTLSRRADATHESNAPVTTDGATPGRRWRTALGDEPDRAVVAGDGVVYAVSTSADDGVITAFEPDSGERRWEIAADVVGRPAANDEYCFYAEDDAVVALDPADGSVAWRASIDGTPRTGIRLSGETLYLASRNGGGRLYAFDAADGRKQWAVGEDRCQSPLSVGSANPSVAGDTLVAAVDGQLRGYATADGTERWSADQRAYALTGGSEITVACWRGAVRAVAPDGTVRWTRELSADVTGLRTVGAGTVSSGTGESADSAGVVVARTVGSPSGHYRALSLADGSLVWTFSTEEGPISMPTTSDGVAYAATGSGYLLAFDPATSDVVRRDDASHGLHDRPAVVDGTVVAPSDEGFLYGFEAP